MAQEHIPTHSIYLCLPRPQRELPSKQSGTDRFESFQAMVNDAWKEDQVPPRYAWVRYSLSVGTPLATFIEAFRGMAAIKSAFGVRVFVHPVRMDHHEIELADFDQMADPDRGVHEIEARWRKKRCDGGSHVFFAVAASGGEVNDPNAPGLQALEALEALIRITLGAMIVVHPRRTMHVDLVSGEAFAVDEGTTFRAYGPAELPRSDQDSLLTAIHLAEQSTNLPANVSGRLSLGMRWANMAFNAHDFLMFWTAIEILTGADGRNVFKIVATAYGHRRPNEFAKELGLDVICQLRGDLTHSGLPVHLPPEVASYLNALIHDIARHIVGLPCLRLAQRSLAERRVGEWFIGLVAARVGHRQRGRTI